MLVELITNISLASIIFLLVNITGGISLGFGYAAIHYSSRHESNAAFNIVFRIVTPILYVIAFAIIFHFLQLDILYHNIWMAVVGVWLIRILYTISWERSVLINWKMLALHAVISVIISIWLYNKVINNPSLLFPSRDNMVSELWLILLLFLYKAMEDVKLGENDIKSRELRYTKQMFIKMQAQYGNIVENIAMNDEIKILSYAIIIHENFNRPKIARYIERLISPLKSNGSYGIMQFKSTDPLNDAKSVEFGVAHLNDIYNKVRAVTDSNHPQYKDDYWYSHVVLKRVAWLYNNSTNYSEAVYNLYEQLKANCVSLPKQIDPNNRYDAFYSSE